MDRALLWVLWNLFLAALPVVFGRRLAAQVRRARAGNPGLWVAVALWSVLWLGFLPNTCYLLTEWRHWFDGIHTAQYWQHWTRNGSVPDFVALARWTIFFAAFSGAGVVAFWAAVRPLAQALRDWRGYPLAGALLFWLNSIGVYLGLELRFNTWDLLHRPLSIARTALAALRHSEFLLMTIGFTLLLWVLYQAVETFAVGLKQRLGNPEEAPSA